MLRGVLPVADLLGRDGAFTPARAAQVAAGQTRALEHLHARGIVQRDLKPAYVVLHATRGPVVLDLGLAKDLRACRRLTAAGEVLGTVSAMSPAQVRGLTVDSRADVYAPGAICYALVAGRSPHPGPAVVALRRPLRGAPPALSTLVPSIAPSLERERQTARARATPRGAPRPRASAEAPERAVLDAA